MTEFGYLEVPDCWWGRRKWPKLRTKLEERDKDWVVGLLDPMVNSIRTLNERCRELETALNETREEVTKSIRIVPKGVGDLTMDIVESEVGDWSRFRNRGQAGSFTGLCSGERPSAGSRRQGGIDCQGNGRIRKQLVEEAVWRLQQWNPGWRAFQKFPHVFGDDATIGPATRKKAVVACARMLMIDLWRPNTDQTTLENLDLNC